MRIFIILSLLMALYGRITKIIAHKDEQTSCIVKLTNGLIRGNCSHAKYDAYTGIPFAKAPVGDLRLEAPQPIDNWRGVRSATSEIPLCIQYSRIIEEISGTEDCLYVHVYVPKEDACHKPLMSIIWIYPGTFQYGSSANSPDLIMASGDTIFITFGYRTGPTGFLSTGTESLPGNLGLKDQRLAIYWVLENIAAFGGDPDQVMLLGDSAGGGSVEMHMITGTSNKINAYASLSNSVLNPTALTIMPEIPAKKLAELVNCPVDATSVEYKNCLKTLPIQSIWQADRDMFTFYAFSPALFRPTIEPLNVPDAFLTEHPLELLKRGLYKDKPYLVGVVEGEGTFMAANLLQFNENNTEVIEELNDKWYEVCPLMFFYDEGKTPEQQFQFCDELKKRYMCGKRFNRENYKLVERMFGDLYFHNGIEESVKLHREAGQSVYRYMADLPTRYNYGNILTKGRLDICFGSVHTSDGIGMLPIETGGPQVEKSDEEHETLNALVELIKSMVLKKQPMYKNITLPANQNDDKPDQCLHFTHGQERLDNCGLPQVNCILRPASVDC